MTKKENILKAIRFEHPDAIPMEFVINDACWHHYAHDDLCRLMESHACLFPDFIQPEEGYTPEYLLNAVSETPYTDPWDCVWKTSDDGITGAVHGHPLENWEHFDSYAPPDPDTTDGVYPIDWDAVAAEANRKRACGELVIGALPHGHTFLRLQDLRGYENLIYDLADEEPNCSKLIALIEEFNCEVTKRWADQAPDIMMFPEDLGMQSGPMLSPDQFRKYIKPCYQRYMKIARDPGAIIHMHSDGDIRLLADDLLDGGVEVLNLQDMVNGVEWIAHQFRGKTAVELDIDRQLVTRFGTPGDIDRLIREEAATIGTKEGGLLMIYGLYPGVPLENIAALMDAMERYADYWRS